jgi:outer membrane protein TolC
VPKDATNTELGSGARRARDGAVLRLALALVLVPAIASAEPTPQAFSIQDAMAAALRTSLPITAARATRDRAAADVRAARAGYFPQINVTGSYIETLKSEYEGLFTPSPDAMAMDMGGLADLPFAATHAWRAGIDVNQPIWDGGKTASAVRLAHGSERAAELDERTRRAQAVLDVTEAYFGAELAVEVAAIADASLALAEQTLAQAQLGLQQGTSPEFDVVRAEVTRDNQKTSLLRARAERDNAMRRLRRLLGVPLDRPIELTTRLGGGDVGELARSTAGVVAKSERVSVAQAKATADIRRAQVGLATASRWPSLSVFTSYGVVDYPESYWPDSDWRTNWTVGAQVSLPLFTGFRTSAQIAGARADVAAAEALALDAAQLAAVDEQERSSDVAVNAEAYAASHRSAELARRAYQIAEVRYRQGVSTYLELVDARISLDQAQINEATAARDLQIAQVRVALLPALPVAGAQLAPSATPALSVTPQVAPATAAPTTPGVPGQPTQAPQGPR